MFSIDYKNDKPLHEQIQLGIKNMIMSGILAPNEKLPSVREMAVSLTVNPNTVQRAYKDLENEGLIYSVVGRGNFVAEVVKRDDEHIKTLYKKLEGTLRELVWLEEPKPKIESIVEKIYTERNNQND